MTKLTAGGKALLTQIGEGKFSFFDNGIVEGSGIWHENVTGEASSKVAKTAKGVSNVVRKLVEDGYLTSSDVEDDNPWVELTELGATTALELAGAAPGEGQAELPEVEPEFDAKAAREALEAKVAAEIAEDILGTSEDTEPEAEVTPIKKAAKKAAATPKKAVTGDKAPAKPAKKAAEPKPAKAPKPKAEPYSNTELPADVATASIPEGSTLKWRNRARETGTVVGVWDAAESITEDAPERWVLHCEAHDQSARFATYKQAWLDSAHPMSFCPSCSVL